MPHSINCFTGAKNSLQFLAAVKDRTNISKEIKKKEKPVDEQLSQKWRK